MAFQKVDDPTPGKNRVHIDFSTADMEAEVERLVGLGASETGRQTSGEFTWVVLADPDGNAFCVAGRLTDLRTDPSLSCFCADGRVYSLRGHADHR